MRDFLLALLTCSVTMSALGLVLLAAMPLLAKRYAAKTRYYLWLVVLVGLLIPFRPSVDHALVEVSIVETGAAQGGVLYEAPAVQVTTPLPEASTTAPPSMRFTPWQLLAALWAAGAVAMLAYRAGKHIRFVRATRRWGEEIADGDAFRLLQKLMEERGMTKRIRLFLCPGVHTPMATGLIRRRILLPSMAYDAEELRYILLHELTHIRRRDLWYRALTLLATAVHWFNPVVYLIGSRVDLLCEIACDSEIVRGTDADARMSYTETIIGAAKRRNGLRTAMSTDFYGGKDGMKTRISSIMDTGKKRAGLLLVCGTLVLTFGTGFLFTATSSTPMPTPGDAPATLTADTLEDIFFAGTLEGSDNGPVSHPIVEGEISLDEAIAIAKTSASRYIQQLGVQGEDGGSVEFSTDEVELLHWGPEELLYPNAWGEEQPAPDHRADFWRVQLRGSDVNVISDVNSIYVSSVSMNIHAQTGLIDIIYINGVRVDADTEVSLERLLACYLEDLGAGGFVPSGEDRQRIGGFAATTIVEDIVGGAAQVRVYLEEGFSILWKDPPARDDGFTTLSFMMDLGPPGTWPDTAIPGGPGA